MTLVKVLLVWSMCSDVTEFGAWGLPQGAASPPPSGRARAGRTVVSSRLAMGSSKAEAVERKGAKRTGEWRGERKRKGCGLRQRVSGAVSQRTSDTPNPSPRRVMCRPSLPALPGWPNICYREAPTSVRGAAEWAWGRGGPLPTDPPGLLEYGNLTGSWVRSGPTAVGGSSSSCQAWVGEGVKFWLGLLWGPSRPGMYMGLPGLKLPGALARALASLV